MGTAVAVLKDTGQVAAAGMVVLAAAQALPAPMFSPRVDTTITHWAEEETGHMEGQGAHALLFPHGQLVPTMLSST